MIATRLLSAAALSAALCSAVPAFAQDASSSSSAGSARIERCARFTRASDYERCARLVRRLPATDGAASSPASSSAPSSEGSDAWKWTNIYNRMEAKINTMVKFASTMGRKFCRDRTAETDETSQECMAKLKAEMQVRVANLIDVAFRGDLPSSR